MTFFFFKQKNWETSSKALNDMTDVLFFGLIVFCFIIIAYVNGILKGMLVHLGYRLQKAPLSLRTFIGEEMLRT